ncbi:eukaryotic translation initiation factor 3 subunit J-like [Branchiostoma floridae]|uniref:Eukaryotic translation initiation factor 3 subunit J n=1 Tax=Branchiostoma floridae TaxID=7739 RepID=A0A9J7MGT0_BRAFL|nr:eukaryotic translation initiation factor 3 subunit J-like [Branchiostoma floridae]
MADWDADDFEPAAPGISAGTDKWEGEDEDDDVKDNWDDEDNNDEKKDQAEKVTAVQKKKKRTMAEIIREKEEKKKREIEERKAREEAAQKEMTPEERAADKLRRQKLAEEGDLELAKDMFGVDSETGGKIDRMQPQTREDFEEFQKALVEKVSQYQGSIHFVTFLEELFRDCCLGLEAEDVRRLGTTLTVLSNEKAKAAKAAKGGKKGKKQASSLKAVKKVDLEDYSTYGDEYDDFM